MMASPNGNIFLVTGPLCGEFTSDRWIPLKRPVTRSFDDFFYLGLNKRLSKQSRGWWFKTPSRPLWRHCNVIAVLVVVIIIHCHGLWRHVFEIIGKLISKSSLTLLWRHNEHGGVSNHQPHDCLFKRLFRCRSNKTSKLCVTGLCVGNSPGTGDFPAQMASNAENVSIEWRHHEG